MADSSLAALEDDGAASIARRQLHRRRRNNPANDVPLEVSGGAVVRAPIRKNEGHSSVSRVVLRTRDEGTGRRIEALSHPRVWSSTTRRQNGRGEEEPDHCLAEWEELAPCVVDEEEPGVRRGKEEVPPCLEGEAVPRP